MKHINTYSMTGLTCNNCANKVLAALKPYAEHIEVSLNPQQIKLLGQKIDINGLNTVLKTIGNYQIGAVINDLNLTSSLKNSAQNSQNIANIVTNDDTGAVSNEVNNDHLNLQINIIKKLLLSLKIYKPLILVFAYILLVCVCVEYSNGSFVMQRFMGHFMAGFFLVFSFFKLLDLTGFANSYAMYDVIAKRIPAYGFIYPFIELALGTAYLLAYQPILINCITLVVMVISLIGVVQAVLSKQKIKCACLGTGFNLPMTTVTIIEDSVMAIMAAWMLI